MNWTIWILASSFFLALYDLAKKASVRDNAVLPVLLCSTVCGCGAFEFRPTIPFVGILLAMADWLYFRGLAVPETPISVGSLLRRFSVVVTFVLGAKFFHEENLKRKSLALAAILLGVVLLCKG